MTLQLYSSNSAKMKFTHRTWTCLIALSSIANFLFTAGAAVDASKLPPPVDRKIDFTKDIQPIFENHCYDCHGPKKQEASLRWDQKNSALKGGESGVAIVPGKSAESL